MCKQNRKQSIKNLLTCMGWLVRELHDRIDPEVYNPNMKPINPEETYNPAKDLKNIEQVEKRIWDWIRSKE